MTTKRTIKPEHITPELEGCIADDGSFYRCVTPGCYSPVYVTEDGGLLCPDCANENYDYEDAQWNVIGAQFNLEGPSLQCDHCYKELPSEYGDPDEDQAD